jgi:hypothetical protein
MVNTVINKNVVHLFNSRLFKGGEESWFRKGFKLFLEFFFVILTSLSSDNLMLSVVLNTEVQLDNRMYFKYVLITTILLYA